MTPVLPLLTESQVIMQNSDRWRNSSGNSYADWELFAGKNCDSASRLSKNNCPTLNSPWIWLVTTAKVPSSFFSLCAQRRNLSCWNTGFLQTDCLDTLISNKKIENGLKPLLLGILSKGKT